jgi:hypothetical protein
LYDTKRHLTHETTQKKFAYIDIIKTPQLFGAEMAFVQVKFRMDFEGLSKSDTKATSDVRAFTTPRRS